MNFKKTSVWLASKITELSGSWWAGLVASIITIGWLVGGLFTKFNNTYMNFMDCLTSIIPFIMVFFIQHTQNRESKALHIKLDELIFHEKKADNSLIHSEQLTEEELNVLQEKYRLLAEKLREKNLIGTQPTGVEVVSFKLEKE